MSDSSLKINTHILDSLLSASALCYAIFDQAFDTCIYSDSFQKLLKLPDDMELTPDIINSYFYLEDEVEREHEWAKQIFEHENCTERLVHLHDYHGTPLTLLVKPAIHTRNQQGEPELCLCSIQNITKEKDEHLQLQKERDDVRWLAATIKKINEQESIATVNGALRELALRMGASQAVIRRYKPKPDQAKVISIWTDKARPIEEFSESDLDFINNSVERLIRDYQLTSLHSLDQLPSDLKNNGRLVELLTRLGVASCLGVTVNRNNQAVAYISLDWNHERQLSEHKVQIAQSIGEAIVTAVDKIQAQQYLNARIDDDKWLAEKLDKLYKTDLSTEALHTQIIENVIKELCQRTGADRGFFSFHSPETGCNNTPYEWKVKGVVSYRDLSFYGEVVPAKKLKLLNTTFVINDIDEERQKSPSTIAIDPKDKVLSTLMVPLTHSHNDRGFLALDAIQHKVHWRPEDVRLAQTIANAIGLLHDRRTSYQNLQESQSRFELAMEAAQDGLWDTNLDTNEVYFSPVFMKLLGMETKEHQGHSDDFPECYHKKDRIDFLQGLSEAIKSGKQSFSYQFRIIDKNSNIRWINNHTIFTDFDKQGHPHRSIGTNRDITTQVKQHQQLRNAQIEADSANAAKGEFLARMSHEIRTPMNAIIGLAEILRDTKLDDLQNSHLRHIDQASKSLLGLINDILDFSKIEAGMLDIEKEAFMTASIVEQVLNISSLSAIKKGIELRCNIADNVPKKIISDPLRLNQIITNLVSNAVKFTSKGSVNVDIALANKTDTKRMYLDISVSDTGIGIAKDQIKILFNSFTQADGSISRRFGGTGLGLSIVKNLVELLEGSIEISSELNKGTCISLQFPVGETAIESAPTPNKQLDFSALKGLRVLLTEDNNVNQIVAKALLTKKGITVSIANNGREAIDELARASEQYDAVLMDIEMPLVDGYQATAAIRKELALSIPIIAMTAHAMEGDREKCLAAGMDDYLNKPIDSEQLYKKLCLVAPSTDKTD